MCNLYVCVFIRVYSALLFFYTLYMIYIYIYSSLFVIIDHHYHAPIWPTICLTVPRDAGAKVLSVSLDWLDTGTCGHSPCVHDAPK